MKTQHFTFSGLLRLLPAGLVGLLGLMHGIPTAAQTCFVYSDNQYAKVPIECVQKGTLLPPCGPPTDCTTRVNATAQTILLMHTHWHQCFGNTLSAFPGGQPAGRGQR